MARREEEYLLQQKLAASLRGGHITRRDFLTRTMVAGLGAAGVGVASNLGVGRARAQDERPLTPTFYQWIEDLHPGIPEVNSRFDGLNYQIAPVEGFGVERFVAESRDEMSTWDVYVGQTPFVEMVQLIEAGVIEPWDDYMPQSVLDDILPSIREEISYNGKIYSWPFLLDVISMGWHKGFAETAGVDAGPPATWDEYLERSQAVIDSGAAPFGCTFDAHGWRSLAPFTHSLSTDVYDEEGLFLFTSEPAIEALHLMKDMMALSHPDILLEGATDGGVNGTPDEVAFGAERVGYYCKYQNAPLRFAAFWPDPSQLSLGALPKFADGEGSTVFWTTGSALFKHGQNKEQVAEYLAELTYDSQIWQDSIAGTETAHPGQLPPYASVYAGWEAERPEWMLDYVSLVREQLDVAKAIPNHLFGLQQFQIGKASWETFLTDEESDPMVAMQAAWDAVQAEMNR
jgi:ABC-type glycerol-3-phosphate transport system substrate-binding protein